jgi:hypothetical protein
MSVVLAFVAALQVPPAEPGRPELCLAHVNVMIAEAMRETGRVAGPSWFIRDWWEARTSRPDDAGALTGEQRTALEASMAERKARDPDAWRAELQACVDEAIEGGALP